MTAPTVPTAPPLATVPNIELIHTGQWDISTGRVTVTTDDLAAAVAALDCPAVRRPVLKLGHQEPDQTTGIRWDGEPAIGWVGNMAVAEDGRKLVGDYVGMPAWLGQIVASAYPDRSAEWAYDYRCQLGHTHPMVVTAIALLGVVEPGIGTLQSLQDVADLYGVEAAASDGAGTRTRVTFTTAHAEEASMPNPRPAMVAASVSVEDVRRAYYSANPSWDVYIEEFQLDPPQLIVVNDAAGTRQRIPVTIGDGDGEAAVSFGDPVQVVIRYDDAAANAASAGQAVLRWASKAESRPSQTPAAAPAPGSTTPTLPTTRKGAGMDPAKLREALGLQPDASDDQVKAAFAASLTPEPAPAPAPAAATPPDPEPEPTLPPKVQTPAASTSGALMLDPATLQALQAQAARGEAAFRQLRENECDSILAAAVKAGKFPPARLDHYKALWAADPDGTKDLVNGLAANVIPVAASGYPGVGAETETDMVYAAMYGGNSKEAGRG